MIDKMKKMSPRRRLGIVALGLILAFFATSAEGCGGDKSATTSESAVQHSNYEQQVKKEPAHTMQDPATRHTINGWIDTWGKPGAMSYVYLQGQDGKLLGYFNIKGLPVSYCTSLTPTWQLIGTPGDGSDARDQQVPAPGMDGVYYSGGDCSRYYGFTPDGTYVEFTVGNSQNMLLYNRPLPQANNVPNLSPTS
jgi:hypothetical protein